jgi:hypothetical protein
VKISRAISRRDQIVQESSKECCFKLYDEFANTDLGNFRSHAWALCNYMTRCQLAERGVER